MIKFVEVDDELEIKSDVLRLRFVRGSTLRTQDYVVLCFENEVGLLILEDWGPPVIYIHEIFVLKEFRNEGIGYLLLSHAEMIAAKLGRSSIRLLPRSLCKEAMCDLELSAWYKRNGYIECASDTEKMEKFLVASCT